MQTIRILPLTLAQIRAAYPVLLVPAFPENELKPLRMIEGALKRGEYVCYGALAGDDIQAVAFFVRIEAGGGRLMLFDYLAVREDLRCQGLGGRFLRALIDGPLKGQGTVLLEVDEPSRADTPEERALRVRRLHFYLRNGLHDTAVLATVYGAAYRILTLPGSGALTPEEVRGLYAELYHAILPPEVYAQRVFIEDESAPGI